MSKCLGALAVLPFVLVSVSVLASSGTSPDSWEAWMGAYTSNSELKVRWSVDRHRIESIQGVVVRSDDGRTVEARVSALAGEVRALQGVAPKDLGPPHKSGTKNRRVFTYPQLYEGLEVVGRSLVISVRKDGAVVGIANNLVSLEEPLTSVRLSAVEARARALETLDPSGFYLGSPAGESAATPVGEWVSTS